MIKTRMIFLCLLMAGFVNAAVIYQDNFDNDTLATNTGIGGGGANKVLDAGQTWSDNGDLWNSRNAADSANAFQDGTLFYSTNTFQAAGGFKLEIVYTEGSKGAGAAGNRFGFGFISDDTDLSTLSGSGLNIFGNATNYYSLGVNLTTVGGTEGLNFSDGTNSTNLDPATLPLSSLVSVLIEIGPGGVWSYSIEGVQEASGTIAGGFDLSKNYHIAVYSQDDQTIKTVHSIRLNEGENFSPAAFDQAVTGYPGVPLGITLTGVDPEGSNLTYNVTLQPTNGVLSGTEPDLTYTMTNGVQGVDSFTFTVNDGETNSIAATVSITVTNEIPTANAQNVSTSFNSEVAITLTGSDPEGSNLTYSVISGPSHGTLSGTEPDLTYTPDVDHLGSDSFAFKVNDGLADSAPARVLIAIADSEIAFTDLNTGLSTNTLKAAGSTNDLVVTGVATNTDYLFSVTYTGADLDGDTINDTLSFEVLVEAWSGSAATVSFTSSQADINKSEGTATIGTTDAAVVIGADGWAVGNTLMDVGETLEFTLQNISVAGSDSAYITEAALITFTGMFLDEISSSYGHRTVVGEGSGLFETRWNQPTRNLAGDFHEENPLYVTSAAAGGLPGSSPQRWQIRDVDFRIGIGVREPQSTVIMVQ